MNGSTFCEIKYMNGIFFVYNSDWGWSENTGSHTHIKITHKLLSPPIPPFHKRDLYLSKNVQ